MHGAVRAQRARAQRMAGHDIMIMMVEVCGLRLVYRIGAGCPGGCHLEDAGIDMNASQSQKEQV